MRDFWRFWASLEDLGELIPSLHGNFGSACDKSRSKLGPKMTKNVQFWVKNGPKWVGFWVGFEQIWWSQYGLGGDFWAQLGSKRGSKMGPKMWRNYHKFDEIWSDLRWIWTDLRWPEAQIWLWGAYKSRGLAQTSQKWLKNDEKWQKYVILGQIWGGWDFWIWAGGPNSFWDGEFWLPVDQNWTKMCRKWSKMTKNDQKLTFWDHLKLAGSVNLGYDRNSVWDEEFCPRGDKIWSEMAKMGHFWWNLMKFA